MPQTMLSGDETIRAKIKSKKPGIFCYKRFLEDEQLLSLNLFFQQEWAQRILKTLNDIYYYELDS